MIDLETVLSRRQQITPPGEQLENDSVRPAEPGLRFVLPASPLGTQPQGVVLKSKTKSYLC